MKAYLDIIKKIQEYGTWTGNRTGVRTQRLSGTMFEHDMREGFPLPTTKKVNLQTVATEVVFFARGLTDKQWLKDRNCKIWNQWCSPTIVPYGNDEETKAKMEAENDLGPIYGYQWRRFGLEYSEYLDGVDYKFPNPGDQLKTIIERLKTNPLDRRMIVSAWNPLQISEMALPPCHVLFELLSDGENLDLLWFQRSCDMFLGVPFNIASYGLLLSLIAKTVGMTPRRLVGFLGDSHIYENHQDQITEQLSRETRELPKLELPEGLDILTWEPENYKLHDYNPHGFIKAPIAV